ncbi:unnamed protein product [Peronospora belbahrii]|uniref:FYVE-type domain-containing protein n=1 Tax=Peronospora belbahrii TaxID=622444 RepID=A0AAU9L715_9STRA|nr:unnamed protein product [Peronospora belbahrii]
MEFAAEASLPSTRHVRITSGNLFRRMSTEAIGMEAAALCHRSHWVPTSLRSNCSNCRRSFHLWGKHHCRLCGEIVCGACSTKRIRYQSKNVRTCDDCIDTKVQNSSEITPQSAPESLRSNTSLATFQGYDVSERRSLPLRRVNSHVFSRNRSFDTLSKTCIETATRNKKRPKTCCFKEMRGMNGYRGSLSRQTQVLSLVIAGLVVSIGWALKLIGQV